jgi:hypothetical protein
MAGLYMEKAGTFSFLTLYVMLIMGYCGNFI